MKASLPQIAEKNSRQAREEKLGDGEAEQNQGVARGGRRKISAEKRMTWTAKESRQGIREKRTAEDGSRQKGKALRRDSSRQNRRAQRREDHR